ncbi:TonB-dependent siderophore receptor, partial [Sphingobium cloacae]|uniref:TonB-dependent siderophore receptor n=1 Tax=Sphingobium cloacae TaxID=120107 RepID=UPI001471335A
MTADADLASGRHASAVRGTMSPAEALSRLLAGTGLTFRFTGSSTVTLEPAPRSADGAVQLGPVRVEGASHGAASYSSGSIATTLTEGSQSYTAQAVEVGGKTARALREIPQSVTVMTAQRLRDQVITTTEDALRQATGVTVTDGSGYPLESFSARGFGLGVQSDGGAPGVSNFWYNTGLPDAAVLDHIEILRGSDGLFAGRGDPGGTVNMVRKRPLDHNQVSADLLAGSWNRYRGAVDVTGPIGWNGRLRGRAVAAFEDRDFFYKPSSMNKQVFYGIAEADVTATTLLTFGGSYEKRETRGAYAGTPRSVTRDDLGLSRDECLCTDWSFRDYKTSELFLRLEQKIGGDWTLKVNLTRQRQSYAYELGYPLGTVNPVTGAGPLLAGSRTDVSNLSKLADVTIDGSFRVLGLKHDLLAGINYQDMFSDGTGVSLYPTRPPADVFNFDPAGFPRPATPGSYVPLLPFGGQKQFGAYATLRSHITNSLRVTAGVRLSNYTYDYAAGRQRYEDNGVWIPYGAVSFDVSKSLTLYGSYTSIYIPQGGNLTATGAQLPPVRGNTMEIGVKGSWLDGKLNGSLAAYRIDRRNGAALDFTSPTIPGCCYVASRAIRAQGIDAELVGEILPGWEMSIGYTYNENKYRSGYGASNGAAYFPRTPRHMLKLWTMARMPGNWSALRLGGGINAQSKTYVAGSASIIDASGTITGTTPYQFTQGAYA